MEHAKQISKKEFLSKFRRTNKSRNEIFGGRKALMEELYATGIPIYCDQSYYAQEENLDLVIKVGEHFRCSFYNNFESWRDCHYYTLYEDESGNKVWLMTGGRYD